jgi:AcrR family transcriptional regulator
MKTDATAKRTAKPKHRRKRPDVRSAEIVEAAAKAFVRDGYASFNLRAVAADVGIRLSSLQHHFPTRESLITAALEFVMEGWNPQFYEIAGRKNLKPVERLKRILHLNLDLIINQPAASVLWELFALSRHEDFAMQFAQESYLEFRRMFAELLREVRPDLSDDQLMAHATLIAAQTEGLTLFMRPGDPAGLSPTSIREALDIFAEGVVEKVTRQKAAS